MKRLKIVYVVLICAVLAAPLLLLPFADSSSAEKRNLSSFPALVDEEGVNLEFSGEVDTWLSEHFPFRSQLISLNNYLKASLFQTSDEDQVVVGKDGWLFFADTLPDYFGDNQFSELQVKQLLTTISLMEEYVSESGADFVFAVAPNKNTVYPEYMPDRYLQTDQKTNLQRVSEMLVGNPAFADLKTALSDTSVQLYHARDSHWNAYGALCGFREIMRAANRDADLFDSAAYIWENNWRGDLEDMIFPALNIRDKQAVFDIDWSYEYTSNYHTKEDILITTENESGEGTLLMFRDSFGNALLPFMAQAYETATFSRATPYDLRSAAACDTVVVEIVERNLANLLKTAPILQAPVRESVTADAVMNATVKTRQKDELLHIYGTMENASENVFLQVSDGEKTVIVQAFPIYETELLGETADKNGFSAYLPAEYKDYTVTVMIGKEG